MKNDVSKSEKPNILYFFLIIISILLIIYAYLVSYFYNNQNSEIIDSANSQNGKQISLPAIYFDDIELTIDISKMQAEDKDTIIFSSYNCSIKVYSSDNMIYENIKTKGYQKSMINTFSIPENSQKIQIQIVADNANFSIKRIYVCAESKVDTIILLQSLPSILLLLLSIAFASFLLLCTIFQSKRHEKILYAVSCIFVLLIALFTLCNTPIIYFTFPSSNVFFIFSCILILSINTCGLMYMLYTFSCKFQKQTLLFASAQALLNIFAILCLSIPQLNINIILAVFATVLPLVVLLVLTLMQSAIKLAILYSICIFLSLMLLTATSILFPYAIFENSLLIYLFSVHFIFDISKRMICMSIKLRSFMQNQCELESMAYTDCMTGIYNRASFDEDISQINNANSHNCIHLLILDINNLKTINDTLGHCYGDTIIRKVANCICENFSNLGKSYRIGGDEFAVILQNACNIDIQKSMKEFNQRIKKNNLDVAFAIKEFDTTAYESIYDLIDAVDTSMYKQKQKMKRR